MRRLMQDLLPYVFMGLVFLTYMIVGGQKFISWLMGEYA